MLNRRADFILRPYVSGNAVSISNDETVATKCEGAIRALGELFSDPKMRAHLYHRYILVQQPSGQLAFEQEEFDFYFEQAVAKAFGRWKPRRRMIRIALPKSERD